MCLVVRCDASQDLAGFGGGSRLDANGAEAAFEGTVCFDVGAVLVESGSPNRLQLAPCKGGFEDVGRIECPLRSSCADNGVNLVDEEDGVGGATQCFEQLLHPLLKLPTKLRAGDECREVQRKESFVAKRVGYTPLDDTLGQPLDKGSLSDPRLTDEHRVVLLAAREHLHHPFDLRLATDDRIETPSTRLGCQIGAETIQ